MLANPEYPRTFQDRLFALQNLIKGAKKVFKLINKIQKRLVRIAPVLKFKVYTHCSLQLPN